MNGWGVTMSSSKPLNEKQSKSLQNLSDSQKWASDPAEHAWLSASAGSGKTQVLTSRVFRLLYRGVDPASILCLTYTKAGAAEMANRINETLARWVRLDDASLASDLRAIGETVDDASRAHARTLFARVLDVPGGLRIQTIHSFAQSLLGSFPVEAGLVPGFELIEGEAQRELVEEAIALSIQDNGFIADVEHLSLRMGSDEARAFLIRCAQNGPAFHDLGPEELIADRVWRGLGLQPGSTAQSDLSRFQDNAIDREGLSLLALLAKGITSGSTGPKLADAVLAFLGWRPEQRINAWAPLYATVITKDGNVNKNVLGLVKKEPSIGDPLARLASWLLETQRLVACHRLAAHLAACLRAGAKVARHYRALKHARAVVDFNDLIHHLHQLLTRPGMGEWVRFKLDQQTDHVLIDEAQDTNAHQWEIIEALTAEYFAGLGAVPRDRSLFVVGDFKQAIFSFQGTNPAAFQSAQEKFAVMARDVEKPFKELSLDTSYRSLSAVLECVDAVLAHQGAPSLGLVHQPNRHLSFREKAGGTVLLWKPVGPEDVATIAAQPGLNVVEGDEAEGDTNIDVDESKRGAEALLARRLALQIRRWLKEEPLFLSHKNREVEAGDIMILLRSRGFLARQIIARLHDYGVPVAGIDRMQLQDALAVKDLLAAMRFAMQPEDDLNLAALLMSPLFGLTQQDLFDVAWKRPSSLWRALRNREEPHFVAARTGLESLLAMADLVSPYGFFERVLSGPIAGRAKMVARLGLEVLDPVEELMVTALDHEQQGVASFAAFLSAMDKAQDDIKREQEGPQHQVRIMTVHGSKGLQAPIVIMADAMGDPDDKHEKQIELKIDDAATAIAVPLGSNDCCHDRVEQALASAKTARDEEHRRLLYVALTRAEEVLCLAGAVGKKKLRDGGANCWHEMVRRALEAELDVTAQPDPDWGEIWCYGAFTAPKAGRTETRGQARQIAASVPEWLDRTAPEEARPPKPLAPSKLGEDLVIDPPGDDPRAEAMLRGTLLHGLFERLPGVAPDRQAALAEAWLQGQVPDRQGAWRSDLIEQALTIIRDPAHQQVFGADSLAEVPLSAVVGEKVISGVVDRLRIAGDVIELVDFKTGRRVPASVHAISSHHVRQMAAYRDALRVIFPGKSVRASLLYTSGPSLFTLADEMLDLAAAAVAAGTGQ